MNDGQMNNGMGVHLLVNFRDCPIELLENKDVVEKIALESAREADLDMIKHEFHQFEPAGVTGFILIGESHLSIHTWPEYGSAAVDIFCCFLSEDKKEMAMTKAENTHRALVKRFKPKKVEKKLVMR